MQKILKRVSDIIKFNLFMKKLVVVLCVAAVAFAFTSCDKETKKGTCKCSGTYALNGVLIPVPPTGPVTVGDYTGTECTLYDWDWTSLVPGEHLDNFTYTCKSE
jgi:hypothetical protein